MLGVTELVSGTQCTRSNGQVEILGKIKVIKKNDVCDGASCFSSRLVKYLFSRLNEQVEGIIQFSASLQTSKKVNEVCI